MVRFFKVVHFLGLTLFLGSILTFVVVSSLTKGAGLADLVFGRRLISAGTSSLTLPGMWLILVSGIVLTINGKWFWRHKWLNIKHIVIVVVVLNAHFLVVPAVASALVLAQQSLSQGALNPGYDPAYMRESVFGGTNVLLVLFAMVAAIWKFGERGTQK